MTSIDIEHASFSKEKFEGRTAIATGGASGIGFSTAKLLHSLGCNVLIGDVRPPDSFEGLNSGSESKNAITYCECDITSWSTICNLFETTVTKFGGVDMVHANAGINDFGNPFFSLNFTPNGQEPDHRTIELNVKGTINTIAIGMNYMKKNPKGGSIILTASPAGYFGTVWMPLYTASKHWKY
jgi:NAD(P)-dependent dehydrogenase (short-subunit alcohol dehydrogenase family)